MKTHGFLDQLMKTAQQSLGGGMESLTGSKDVKGAVGGPFGKGALVGGALGLLLGNRKARKMAYKAYGEYQKQKSGVTAGSMPATPPAALPPPDMESHSQAILKALIAAAKADGHVDDRERELIEGEFRRIDADPQTQQWLHAELQKPLDPAEIARAATTPELASEMYLASLLAADEQNFMERAYLDELARQLKIDDALKAKLEQQLRDAEGVG
jgi:uncharacterized membrane protein YebE (DUF533 family)